jgi:hypothetical protein
MIHAGKQPPSVPTTTFMPGDLVEVRSEAEILATLDEKGTLEKLPFMPEMLKFCGQQFRIARRALKTCIDDQDTRGLDSTVFLEEVRCDGANHNGCARACLIFWKEAWLKPVNSPESTVHSAQFQVQSSKFKVQDKYQPGYQRTSTVRTLSQTDLAAMALQNGKFFCQSSELVAASQPLPWWEAKQYLWELKYNRIPFQEFMRSIGIAVYNKLAYHLHFRSWGMISGNGTASTTPQSLDLRPGELVRVKSLPEIKSTLDSEGKNRNLLFAPAMKDFCGEVMRVKARVENIVLEGTSRQRTLKDTVLLEGATCDGVCHRMCPRQSFLFFRECWLERV